MVLHRSQAQNLREIASRLNLPTITVDARVPGVTSILRVTIRYHDERARDSVASLTRTTVSGWTCAIHYRSAFDGKPLRPVIMQARADNFVRVLAEIGFDRLHDPHDLPLYDAADLWLVERAASTFVHALVIAPDTAKDAHALLVNAIKNGMPEMIRYVSA